ncbi:RidA family protein [Marinomonas sp. 15G1-11]|uniref:RidA family protein n=1 Tax=Marinomonas phaeophyticola TaxID=3004091 RepID=A0ABT4JUY0_9GAMM|nr:RidA family protein [Marinomonas sp. 15G1-11]MCZ2721847.1 RidA family protein [Marinomonas sp. 15G1-11]
MEITHIESTERMSRIVKHNGTIYLCGQTAGSDEWDTAEQTRRCLEKIEGLLEKAGSSAERMLSVTIYIRDMKDFTELNNVWDAWIADKPKPARACVEARMASQNVLVEFSVTAAEV